MDSHLKLLFSCLLQLCTSFVSAQELTVKSFIGVPTDLSAASHIRNDLNGKPCGLVKVQLAMAGAQFEGNVIAPVENKMGEYWVYMTEGVLTFADFNNGGFETWADGQPTGWKSASSASTATLSQSTDAHEGNYSVKVSGTTYANKRLAYQEMIFEAGSYTITFYAKAATAAGASVRAAYVPIRDDGSVGSYVVGDLVSVFGNDWVKVEYIFDLAEETTVCLIVMNYKNPGADVLINDFTITKR